MRPTLPYLESVEYEQCELALLMIFRSVSLVCHKPPVYLQKIVSVAEEKPFLRNVWKKLYICPPNENHLDPKLLRILEEFRMPPSRCVCISSFLPSHLSRKKIQNSSLKIKISRNLSPRWWFWSVVHSKSYEQALSGSKYLTLGEINPHHFGVTSWKKFRKMQGFRLKWVAEVILHEIRLPRC